MDKVKARKPTGKLAGVAEIAAILGVSRARAYTISTHWSFPSPFDVLNADGDRPQAVWLRKDIEKWVEENR